MAKFIVIYANIDCQVCWRIFFYKNVQQCREILNRGFRDKWVEWGGLIPSHFGLPT